MKIKEAIVILENERPHCGEKATFTEEEKCEAYAMAIAAMKKQEGEKPLYNGVDYECPYCNTTIVYGVKPWHCDICGQKIWWTEGE